MDDFLANVGVQAMRYAIRSGIALTSSYAISQCSRLLKTVDDKNIHSELRSLQTLLDIKIKVISPAIDLVEFKSGRGNVFLESALPLAKSLHRQIISLGHRIEAAAAAEEHDQQAASKAPSKRTSSRDGLKKIVEDIKKLLDQIDREIPLLQLAISASGESLSTSLPAAISPSRLLQASTLLMFGDTQYAQDPWRSVQIGPSFTLSIYMLFLGHASLSPASKDNASKSDNQNQEDSHPEPGKASTRVYGLGEYDRKPVWQEAIHKARVRLCRSACTMATDETAPSQFNGETSNFNRTGEYAYHLEIIEDLDDGRVHEGIDAARPYDGIQKAGIRECIPIHQLSKVFYTDTGRILNIGDGTDGENNPVLLLKRDVHAPLLQNTVHDLHGEVYGAIDDKSHSESDDDEQADIDRQLRGETSSEESPLLESSKASDSCVAGFPKHLDPEWIALEVFEEDVEDDASSVTGDDVESLDDGHGKGQPARYELPRQRNSLDLGLISQIRNLSVRSTSGEDPGTSRSTRGRKTQELAVNSPTDTQEFVSRSPFGAITTSLSLIEMLIRLAGLQEFQQASHLSIPDHILTFFLEETSTTGLTGEAMWRTRSETKQRVGFDPYTDTPMRSTV